MKECKEKATLPCYRDDTHEKVYELNKQMCDIGKAILTKKKDDMEEKKTKKMTKAEAFEYFKKKKILAKEEGTNIGVQEKLFQCGIEWVSGISVPFYHSDYLIVEESGHLYHCGHDDRYWFAHHYESVEADDILSIEIVDEKYELEFNYDNVVELAKPLMAYLNEVGFRDSIRVSQFGIVHEPMSTLIFDNGIGE